MTLEDLYIQALVFSPCHVSQLNSLFLLDRFPATAVAEPEEPKFNPFMGTGRRLDGKPGKHSIGPVPSATTSAPVSTATTSAQRPTGTPPASSQRPSGKLVFGGSSSNGQAAPSKVSSVGKWVSSAS